MSRGPNWAWWDGSAGRWPLGVESDKVLVGGDGVIRFGEGVCGDLEQAKNLEWLETNGLGGFSSSTIVGMNTRRYHGLLIAALQPPTGRSVLLSKLEETLLIGGRHY